MAYCTKCGKQNPETAKFCTACGGTLTAITPSNVQKKKKSRWLITGGILLAGLLVVSYFIFFNNPKKQDKVLINDDTKTSIKGLVNEWNSAINSGNASSVSALYAANLVYYRQSVNRKYAEMTLYDFFQKNPNFSQQITSEITVEKKVIT
jgi:uncharacterized membrane protein YvbJ